MTPVKSSVIAAVGHDGGRTLTVQFLSGAIHKYGPVSPSVHQEMLSSKSVGSFFNKHIKHLHSTKVA